jgi:AcrR family transcriptional regulator
VSDASGVGSGGVEAIVVDQLPINEMSSAPSERADARANRRRLIEAAHEVFRERGLDAEMKEIAERAGVGIGTIYRNFPGKDDLIAAIVGQMVANIGEVIASSAAVADPVEAVRSFLRGGFGVMERYGDLAMLVLHGNMPPGCQEHFDTLDRSQVGEVLRRGIASGVFRPDLNIEVAVAWLSSAFVPWNFHELRRTYTIDEIVCAYSDLFLKGATRDG